MKFSLWLLLFLVVSIALGPYMTYWMMMLLWAVMGAIMAGPGAQTFFAAGLGVALAWAGKAFYITWITGSSLPDQMSALMGINNTPVLIVATGLLGLLIGGFSALTGNRFRRLFEKNKEFYYH
ncbi:hypothetical protein GCM10007049_33780 [Echinicola pacifica]|uniref:Uncharacterized protein n=1 Tax=Echinicola pacifica TaxID=346377 RepID=A0A918UVQ9_9BACT|nr:hypothetical protein [Echinicola pacifica]GGZ37781.1 hypothetical protein GCM10007049_33780 [Echinicola pacifica]